MTHPHQCVSQGCIDTHHTADTMRQGLNAPKEGEICSYAGAIRSDFNANRNYTWDVFIAQKPLLAAGCGTPGNAAVLSVCGEETRRSFM